MEFYSVQLREKIEVPETDVDITTAENGRRQARATVQRAGAAPAAAATRGTKGAEGASTATTKTPTTAKKATGKTTA